MPAAGCGSAGRAKEEEPQAAGEAVPGRVLRARGGRRRARLLAPDARALFSEEAERLGATRHLLHESGAKRCIDRAGDAAYLTDKLLGAKTKVYALVVTLPFSGKLWAGGFCGFAGPYGKKGVSLQVRLSQEPCTHRR